MKRIKVKILHNSYNLKISLFKMKNLANRVFPAKYLCCFFIQDY